MPPFETARLEALRQLARERYGDVSPAEDEVLQRSVKAADDPESLSPASKDRPEIHAGFLRWFATDKGAGQYVDPRGIRVRNASITDFLDLDFCVLPFPLEFDDCTFHKRLYCRHAEIPVLYLLYCDVEDGIYADDLKSGNVFLRYSKIHGKVILVGAQISGDLDCEGAKLLETDQALRADRAKISGNVYLRNEFSAAGDIYFFRAAIGADFYCADAAMMGLLGEGAQITGSLVWEQITVTDRTSLSVPEASFAALHDDRASWPKKGNLYLRDCSYKDLVLHKGPDHETLPGSAQDRIEWLLLQSDDEVAYAQPWMQLAKVLEENGDPSGAKKVRYEFQRFEARRAGPLTSIASLPFDILEREPLWIAPVIATLWLGGSFLFWRAERMRAMVITNEKARAEFETDGEVPAGYPPFNAVIYALENVLPVVKLGQDKKWAPNHRASAGSWLPEQAAQLRAFAGRSKFARWFFRLSYRRLALLRWTLIVLGWALALILAAAIGARFKESP